MNNSRTREELFLFRDLAKTNMTEFEQLISISIGAVGKIVYDPQFTVIYCSEGISKLIGVLLAVVKDIFRAVSLFMTMIVNMYIKKSASMLILKSHLV